MKPRVKEMDSSGISAQAPENVISLSKNKKEAEDNIQDFLEAIFCLKASQNGRKNTKRATTRF